MPRAPKADGHYAGLPWKGSQRRTELPSDWATICARVKHRSGGTCELVEHGERCSAPGQSVDHIRSRTDHGLANLQHLCRRHHAAKTGWEGARAVRRNPRFGGPEGAAG